MQRWHRRGLIVEGIAWLVAARFGVRGPVQARLGSWVEWLTSTSAEGGAPSIAPEPVVRAFERAAQYVPDTTCLSRALALGTMLRVRRVPCVLRIGVQKRDGTTVQAHAWLELGGAVLYGGEDADAYVPLG
jgi:hypothetical protein